MFAGEVSLFLLLNNLATISPCNDSFYVAKPKHIELSEGEIVIPILYEDRSVLALDKPSGWMLAPDSWDRTGRNLQLALHSSMNAGDFWAHSRNLKYLRFVHRLDAETTGITLFAKSAGALRAYSELFENRARRKNLSRRRRWRAQTNKVDVQSAAHSRSFNQRSHDGFTRAPIRQPQARIRR